MSEINWKKGDILETPDGRQFMFGHYEGYLSFWVHRITKSGKMDGGSQGSRISKDGVVPAVFDPAKRGGWPKRKATKKTTKKKTPAKRGHRWGGAGYVCVDCGGIKDTNEGSECPSRPGTLFDLWLYHKGAGWWLEEEDIGDAETAGILMAQKVGYGNTIAGAVLPAGKPLGLFTKRMQ